MPATALLSKQGLSSNLLEIVHAAPIPALNDSPRDEEIRSQVRNLIREEGIQGSLQESGLWLLAGELDLSHEVSQADDSAEGSFWHGIMHRREGDFGNSKYWFRRVGRHTIHDELLKQIQDCAQELPEDLPLAKLTDPAELPFELVDCCQQALNSKADWEEGLKRICWWEWELLFNAS